jgi:hypothetical protein
MAKDGKNYSREKKIVIDNVEVKLFKQGFRMKWDEGAGAFRPTKEPLIVWVEDTERVIEGKTVLIHEHHHVAMPIPNSGIFVNIQYYGMTEADFGKCVNVRVEIYEKTVPDDDPTLPDRKFIYFDYYKLADQTAATQKLKFYHDQNFQLFEETHPHGISIGYRSFIDFLPIQLVKCAHCGKMFRFDAYDATKGPAYCDECRHLRPPSKREMEQSAHEQARRDVGEKLALTNLFAEKGAPLTAHPTFVERFKV